MTWYMVVKGEQGTHHGQLVRGRLMTDCGGVFGAYARLDLAPGEWPSDPAQVCRLCAGEAR